MSTNIRFKRSDIPGKVPSLDSIDLGELALNTADGKLFTKQEMTPPGGVAAIQKIVEIGASSVPNVLYVSKGGDDGNDGRTLGTSFLSLKKALSIATPGTTIFLKSGEYIEDNPLRVPARVSIVGDNLRNATVRPKNPTKDIFWVYNGAYIFQMNFKGHIAPSAAVCFPPDGSAGEIVTSPYTQAVTSITTTGTGMRVDGAVTTGLRSMVCDAFTQYNQGGIGIHMLNRGNTQLVSIFTICCDISFMCENGGFCSVNLSNSSFGNYGLVSRGASEPLYRGVVKKSAGRQITFKNLTRRPNIGDGVLFANYNQKTCDRDNGLVVDSLAFDLLYEGTTQSTFAGLRYWAKDGITIPVNQQEQTVAAIEKARELAKAAIVGATAKRIVDDNFKVISGIVDKGPISPALFVDADYDLAEPEFKEIRKQVLDAKTKIEDDTLKFLAINYPQVSFLQSKCRRDIGLLIQAVADDMIMGKDAVYSTYKSTKFVQVYKKTGADNSGNNLFIENDERLASVEAFKFVRDQFVPIVQENATLLARANALFNIVTEGLRLPANALANPTYGANQDTPTDVINLVANLQANKDFVAAEVIDYLNENWPTIVAYGYNNDTCKRDIKLSIDAICYDMMYGGNMQTLDAAKRYYDYADGLSQLKSSEEVPATIDAFGRTQLLSQRVVINDPITRGQTVVNQDTSGTATTQTQVNRLGGLFSLFLKQLEKDIVGTSDFIQPNGNKTTDSELLTASTTLQSQKQTIKDAVISYLTVAYPGFEYDKVKCARDVGYIVDSVCFDLVHGGNRQSVTAGIYYFDFNEDVNVLKSVIPQQIKQTVNAYKYMKELLRDVLTCEPTPNPWQGAVPQVTNLPAATSAEVVAVGNLIDEINEILQEGPNNAEDSIQRMKQPISLVATQDANKVNAFNLLLANRQFIQAEMLAYINQNWYTISDGDTQFAAVRTATDLTLGTTTTGFPTVTYQPAQLKGIRDAVLAAKEEIKTETTKFMANSFFDNFSFNKPKCYRDVGLILDAIWSDMVFGTDCNYKTVNAAISYLRAYASEVVGAQKVQTVASLKAAKDITLKRVVNPTAKEEIATRFDIVINILNGATGPGVTTTTIPTLNYPIPSRRSEDDLDRFAAVQVLRNNIDFIKEEVTAFIESNFTLDEYDREKCARDTGLLVDAVGYDMMFGSNFRSITAGRSYMRGNASKVTNNQKLATLGAFKFLKEQMIKLVDKNTLAINSIENCMDTILAILDKGEDAVPKIKIPFPATGRLIEYKRSRDLVSKNRDFIIEDVLAYTNTPGLELMNGSIKHAFVANSTTVFRTDGAFVQTIANYDATTNPANSLKVNDLVRISGVLFGTSKISGYASPTTYKVVSVGSLTVAGTGATREFRLVNIDGSALLTAPGATGRTDGMRFDIIRANSSTAVTATTGGATDTLTATSTSWMFAGMPVQFSGTVFGSVVADTTYYVKEVVDSTTFKISSTPTGNAFDLTTASGSMTVASNFYSVPTNFNIDKCRRDLNYILDAVIYDITYGGTLESKIAADSYFVGLTSQLDPIGTNADEVEASKRAYAYMKGIVLSVAQDAVWAPVVGNTAVQVRSPNGSDGSVNAGREMGACIDVILDALTKTDDSTGNEKQLSLPELSWVDPELRGAFDILQLNRNSLKTEVTEHVDENYVLFGYNRAKCRRDVKYVIDAVRFDMMFGSNQRSITAGESYYRAVSSTVVKDQKNATLESFKYLKTKLLEIVKPLNPDNPTTAELTAISRVTQSMDIILDILENGEAVAPAVVTPQPSGTTIGAAVADNRNARDLIALNREYIKAEIEAYIATTAVANTYNKVKCRNDLDKILDALYFDLTYGGNLETLVAARAYYDGAVLGTGELAVTSAAYEKLGLLVEFVALNTTPTGNTYKSGGGNYQATVSRVTGTAGGATWAQRAQDLIGDIKSYLDNPDGTADNNNGVATRAIDVTWVDVNIRTFNDKLADTTRQDALALAVSDYVDANFAYSREKCQRDVGFLIDALCYDLLYGGNVNTTQAATSYFDGAVTPKSVIPKQIIQTVAAYERMKDVVAQVVQLRDVQNSSSKFTAVKRVTDNMNLITKIIRDGLSAVPARYTMPLPKGGTNASVKEWLDVRNNIAANREFIKEQAINYVSYVYPDLVYNKAKCRRDVDLVLDAVLYDLTYGGNSATAIAANSYFPLSVTLNLPNPDQDSATADMFTYVASIVDEIGKSQYRDRVDNAITTLSSVTVTGTGGVFSTSTSVSVGDYLVFSGTFGTAAGDARIVVPDTTSVPTTRPGISLPAVFKVTAASGSGPYSFTVQYLSNSVEGSKAVTTVVGSGTLDNVIVTKLPGQTNVFPTFGTPVLATNASGQAATLITSVATAITNNTAITSISNPVITWVDSDLQTVVNSFDGIKVTTKTAVEGLMEAEFPSISYVGTSIQTNCEEDIDAVFDAIKFDVAFGSNFRSQLAGKAYFRAITGAQNVLATQRDASVAVFELVRDRLVNLVSGFVQTQNKTGLAGNLTAGTFTESRIQDIINILNGEAASFGSNPQPTEDITWVDADLRTLSTSINSAKTTTKNEVTDYLNNRFVATGVFTYDVNDCKADIESVMDAVRYDMMFNSNFRTITAAKAYYRAQASKVIGEQKFATIEAFKLLKEKLVAIVTTNDVAVARVSKLMDTLVNILDKGLSAVPEYKITAPTGYNTSFLSTFGSARNLIEDNRDFIKNEILTFIYRDALNNNISGSVLQFDEVKCLRDVDFILDALHYDLTYGVNYETLIAANAYYINNVDNTQSIGADDLAATKRAYAHLKTIVARIARGQDVTDIQVLVPQTFGDAGSVAGSQTAKNLAFVIRNLINSVGSFKVASPALVEPSISWVPNNLRAANDTIVLYKTSDSTASPARVNIAAQVTAWVFDQQTNASPSATWYVYSGGNPKVLAAASSAPNNALVKGKRYKIKTVGDGTFSWPSVGALAQANLVFVATANATLTANSGAEAYEMFNYDIAKCERDINYVVDAVRFDMMFNTSFRTATAARSYWRAQAKAALANTDQNATLFTYGQKAQSKLVFEQLKVILQQNIGIGDTTAQGRIGTLLQYVIDMFDPAVTTLTQALAKLPAKPFSLPTPTGGTNNARDAGFLAARNLVELNRDFIKTEILAWIDQQKRENRQGFVATGTLGSGFAFNRVECAEDLDLILDAIYYDLTYGGNMESFVAGTAYYSGALGLGGSGLDSLPADEREATIRAYNQLGLLLADITRNVAVEQSQKSLKQVKGSSGGPMTVRELGTLMDIVIGIVKGGVKQVPPKVEPNFMAGDETLAYVRMALNEQKFRLQADIADYIDSFILQYNTEKCARDVGLIIDAAMYDLVLGSNFQSITAGSVYSQKAARVVTSTQIGPQLEAIKFVRDKVIEVSQRPPLAKNEYAIGQLTQLFDLMYDIVDKGDVVAPKVVNIAPQGAALNPSAINAANILVANKEFLKEEAVAYITANYKTYDQSRCARDVGLIIEAVMYDLLLGVKYNSTKAAIAYRRATSSLVITDQLPETLAAIDYVKERVTDLITDGAAIADVTASFELISNIINGGSTPALRLPGPGGSVYSLARPTGMITRDPNFALAAGQVNSAKATIISDVSKWILAQINNQLTTITESSDVFTVDTPFPILANNDQIRVNVALTDNVPATIVAANTTLYVVNVTAPAAGKQTFQLSLTQGGAAITGINNTSFADGDFEVMAKGDTNQASDIWNNFTYTGSRLIKCEEDVGYILDAIQYDLTYGGNMETLVAGRAYYAGTTFADPAEIPTTIAAYTYLAERVATSITNAVAKEEARKLVLSIRNLIDSAANSVAAERLPDQLWVEALRQEIATTLRDETNNLQNEVIDYIQNIATYTGSLQTPDGYDVEKCRRDIALVLEAIRYDQMFGTTFRTISAGRSYRRAIASTITSTQADANKKAFRELKERVVGKQLAGVKVATPLLKNVVIEASGQILCDRNYIKVDDQIVIAGTLTGNGAVTNGTYYVTAAADVTVNNVDRTRVTLSASQGGGAISTTAGASDGLTFTGNWDGRFICTDPTTVDTTPLFVDQALRVSGVYSETLRTTDFRGLSLEGYSNLVSQPKTYYVISTNGTTKFQLSATQGGAAIAVTTGITTNNAVETPNQVETTGLTFETRPSLPVLDAVTTQGLLDTTIVTPNNLVAGVSYKIKTDGDTTVSAGDVIEGGRYRVVNPGSSDFSTVGAHLNTAGVEFIKNATPLTGNGTAVYITDFKKVGARSNDAGTVFVATGGLDSGTMGTGSVTTLGIRESVERLFDLFLAILENNANQITALGFHNEEGTNVPARTGGKTVNSSDIVTGRMYRILTVGNTDWNSRFGVADAFSRASIDPPNIQHSPGQVFYVSSIDTNVAAGNGTAVELDHYVLKEGFYSPVQTSVTTTAASGNIPLSTTASGVTTSNLVVGRIYEIATAVSTSTTDPVTQAVTTTYTVAGFTAAGCPGLTTSANPVGTQFVCTTAATGVGTVKDITNKKAVEYINVNRQFIEDEVLEWIDQQIKARNGNFTATFGSSFTSGDKTTCRRDVKYLLDAITFDLTFGGNLESIIAGKAYYSGTQIATDILQTIDAYNFLSSLLKQVVVGASYTTLQTAPTRAYVAGSLDATGNANTAVKANVGTLVTEIISYIDRKATDPVELEADKSWVESELVVFSDRLKAEADAVALATTNYVTANYPNLVYNVATCQRDVKLIIDAVRWDMMFNSNFRTIIAARSYYRKQVLNGQFTTGQSGTGSQKPATLAAFGVVKVALDEIVKSDDEAQLRVAALMDIVIAILDKANLAAVNTYVNSTLGGFKIPYGGTPNAFDPGYLNARDRIEENREFIIREMRNKLAALIAAAPYNSNAPTGYSADTCIRDVELVLDAVRYDLTYGGNMESVKAGAAYYNGSILANGDNDHVALTQSAYAHLATIVGAIAQNNTVTPTAGALSTPAQITGNAAGSAAAGAQATALVNIVKAYADENTGNNTAEVKPSLGWVDSNLSLLASTMADSKESLGQQVTDYINVTFPDLEYTEATCQRDVGLVVDAVRYDMMFGTNFRSYTAGRSYLRSVVTGGQFTTGQNGTGSQKPASIAAFKYLKTLLAAIVAGNATALARVRSAMNVVIDVLESGATTRNAYNPVFATAATAISSAKETLQNTVITWLAAAPQSLVNGTSFGDYYSSVTCKRDLGYVIDALQFDLTYGGNMESLIAGRSYYEGAVLRGTGGTASADHKTITKSAFTKLATEIKALSGVAKSADDRVDALVANINAMIDNDESVTEVLADASWVESEVQEVSVDIRNQKSNIVAQVLDFVVDKFPTLANVYNTDSKCARDIGYVIDAVRWDMLLNSNFRSITAGRSYARSVTIPANEKPATLAAFSYLKTLLQDVAGGGVIDATNYQSGRFTVTGGLGRQLAFDRLTENMDIVLELLQQGVDKAVDDDLAADEITVSSFPLNATVADRTAGERAVAILMANKQFIQDEIFAYIKDNLNPMDPEYDEATCARDVDYITRAVAYDMVNGSNYQSVTAGLSYVRKGAQDVLEAKQKHVTILALRYLKHLLASYVVNTPAAATAIKAKMDIIIGIVNGASIAAGETSAGAGTVPVLTFPAISGQTLWTATSLATNRSTIITNTIAALTGGDATAYAALSAPNKAKCQRDLGYVIDALQYDLTYGGNWATVINARSYYVGVTQQLDPDGNSSAEVTATKAALEALKTQVDSSVDGTVNGVLADDRADTLIDIVKAVIDGGLSAVPEIVYPQLIGNVDNALESARNVLLSNIESAKKKVIRKINDRAYFLYDSVTCERDLKLIIDAVLYDSITNSNYLSLQAGRTYSNPGVASIAAAVTPRQKFAILAGLQYAKTYFANKVSNSALVQRIRNKLSVVIDVINDGNSNYVSLDVPTTQVTVSTSQVAANTVLTDGTKRSAIISDAITAAGNSGGSVVATCTRDLNYVLDALAHDLTYGGNWGITVCAKSYYFGGALQVDQSGEKAASLAAFTNLKTSIKAQTGWNTAENTNLDNLVDILLSVLNGPSDAADLATANALTITKPTLAGASTIQGANKTSFDAIYSDELVADHAYFVLDAINDRPYLDPDFTTKCARDTEIVLKALQYDTLLGGYDIDTGLNYNSVRTGQSYLRSYAKVVTEEQKSATISALYHIKKVVTAALDAAANVDDNTYKFVRSRIDIIIDILDRGPSAIPAVTGLSGNAVTTLANNRAFIKAEIRAYIDRQYPNLDYDKVTCERDVDIIIDALRYDLAYAAASGQANSATREAGLAYWEGNALTLGATPTGLGTGEDEKVATVAAYEYLATLVSNLIANSDFTPYQTIVSKGTFGGADAGKNTAAAGLITKLKDAVNATSLATATTAIGAEVLPALPTATNNQTATATVFGTQITNLPALLNTEIKKAFLDYNGDGTGTKVQFFVYNSAKCLRDVGYVTDALAFDLLFGGNKETREAGLQYAYKGGLVIPFATKVPTVKTFERLASFIDNILSLNTAGWTKSSSNSSSQVTTNAGWASNASTLATTAADLVTNNVVAVLKGLDPEAKVEPSFASAKAGYTAIRDAALDAIPTIQENTIKFVNENFIGFGYLQDTCKRDIGLTVDAVAYDLIYGGNSRTKFTAEQYFSGGRLQIPADSKSATVACFNHMDYLARKLIRNEPITTFQDYVDQDFSGVPATSAEVSTVASLFDAFTDVLANGYISVVELDASFKSSLDDNTFATFHQVSTITTTGHTLEWVGTGIDVDSALPYNGGVPKPENEIVSERGGFINFTSTDHKGDFRIGPDLTIKRDSGSIVGRAFNKSLLGVITPYILALQG